jgi:hypothetical protein
VIRRALEVFPPSAVLMCPSQTVLRVRIHFRRRSKEIFHRTRYMFRTACTCPKLSAVLSLPLRIRGFRRSPRAFATGD